MPSVFISYRRDDTAGEAGHLADDLGERFGRSRVFIDVDSIPLATNFEDRIHAALDSCQVVIVLIGDEWLTARLPSGERRIDDEGDYLRQEVAAALRREDVAVFPVLVDDATMPRPEDLPSDIAELAKINALDLSHKRWSADVRTLCEVAERYDTGWSRVLTWVRERMARTALIAGLAVGIIVAAILAITTDVFDGSSGGGSIGEQVDGIRAELQADGFEVRYRELELHPGPPSHLFIASKLTAQDARATSDEVRIYDPVDRSLELQLTYRPEVRELGSNAATPNASLAAAFQPRTVADIDGDGQDEILGVYEANQAGEEFQRVPVLIARETGEGYRVTPMLALASFDRGVTAGLPAFEFGPAGGQVAPTLWVSDLALDTRARFSTELTTLATVVVGAAAKGSGLSLEVAARAPGAPGPFPRTIRFWGIEMDGSTPSVTPLCVRGAGPVPQPLVVRADPGDTEALVGKPLAGAMADAGLVLGRFSDGQCQELGS
jgi:hypothetical protein